MKSSNVQYVLTISVLALGGWSLAQTTPGPQVDVQVSGPTRDAAYGQAVEKGLEALLGRVLTPGSSAYSAALAGVPRTEVKLGRIVSEQASGGTVSMTVQVSLAPGVLEQAIVRAQPQLAQTRIAVVIPEAIIRRPTPDPAAETEINRALIGAGLRVVDASTQATNAARELVRAHANLDRAALADLRTRLNADLLVTGEAFAEEYNGSVAGLRGYTSRLEVKVIDLSSGQMLHSQAFQGSAVGATDSVAGKTALMNVGKAAGVSLPGVIMKALQGSGTVAQRVQVVRIAPPVTFAQVNAFATRLKTAAGVQGVTVRTVDNAGAVLEVQYGGAALELAALLEGLGAKVSGLTGAELTIQF